MDRRELMVGLTAMAMSVAEAGGGAQADLWSGGRWSKGEYLESSGGEDCEGRT